MHYETKDGNTRYFDEDLMTARKRADDMASEGKYVTVYAIDIAYTARPKEKAD